MGVATTRSQVWTAIVCGMAGYVEATATFSLATAYVLFAEERGLRSIDIGLLAGVLTFAVAVGAIGGGRLGDRIGRRAVFLGTMGLVILGFGVLLVSPLYPVMLLAVTVIGLGVGADMAVTVSMVGEVADDRHRGLMVGLGQMLWLIGLVVPSIIAAVVGNDSSFAVTIVLGQVLVTAVLVLLGRLTLPESPRYLAAAGQAASEPRLRDLLRPELRVPLVALIVFAGFSGAASSIFSHFGTYLLVNGAGLSVQDAARITLLVVAAAVAGSVTFLFVVDGRHRFRAFTLASVVIVLSQLAPLVFGPSVLAMATATAVMTFAIAFAGDTLTRLWTTQTFPTLLRSTTQGVVIAATRFSVALLAPFVPVFIDTELRSVFVVSSVMFAIGLGTAWAVFRRRDGSVLPEDRPVSEHP